MSTAPEVASDTQQGNSQVRRLQAAATPAAAAAGRYSGPLCGPLCTPQPISIISSALQATTAAPARKRRKMDPLTPPPPASEFPPFEPRDFFRFEVVHRWGQGLDTDCILMADRHLPCVREGLPYFHPRRHDFDCATAACCPLPCRLHSMQVKKVGCPGGAHPHPPRHHRYPGLRCRRHQCRPKGSGRTLGRRRYGTPDEGQLEQIKLSAQSGMSTTCLGRCFAQPWPALLPGICSRCRGAATDVLQHVSSAPAPGV